MVASSLLFRYADFVKIHEADTAEQPRDYQEPMPNWEQEREED